MAYIWDDYKIENQFKITDSRICAYMEVWDKEGDVVPVNIFLRLYPFLFPASAADGETAVNELLHKYETEPRYEETANLIMHYIARLDRIKGLSLIDIVMFRIYEDINNGAYGPWLKDAFEKVGYDQKIIILRHAAEYNLKEQRISVYDTVIKQLFKTVRMYFEKSTGTIYIYIGKQRNKENETLLNIADYLFKDIKVKTEVMWQNEHFGVIDISQTMKIDRMALI